MVILNDSSKFLELGQNEKFDYTIKTENSIQRKLRRGFQKV